MSPLTRPRLGLLLLYFARFLTTTVPAQGLLLVQFLLRPTLPSKVWGYLFVVVVYCGAVLVLHPSLIPLKNLLFYFSFILPTVLILSGESGADRFVTTRFLYILCALVICEAILLNSPLAGYLSFFLPADWANSSENVRLFGVYQRPLGIAGNASMTSCVLIFTAVLGDVVGQASPASIMSDSGARPAQGGVPSARVFSFRSLVLTITVLGLGSGTGFGLLILYFVSLLTARIKSGALKLFSFLSAIGLMILATYGGELTYLNDIRGFGKFGSTYAVLVFGTKLEYLTSALKYQGAHYSLILLGNQIDPATLSAETGSDFGFLNMYNAIGLLGFLCVLGAPLLFASSARRLAVPTMFFYVTFLHYPGLLSPPGAVLFGLYLATLYRREQDARDAARSKPAQLLAATS
jgi:hypothetical protein